MSDGLLDERRRWVHLARHGKTGMLIELLRQAIREMERGERKEVDFLVPREVIEALQEANDATVRAAGSRAREKMTEEMRELFRRK